MLNNNILHNNRSEVVCWWMEMWQICFLPATCLKLTKIQWKTTFFLLYAYESQQQEYMSCKNAGIALFALTYLENYI